MKTTLGLVLVGLIVAIAVPSAVIAAQPDSASVAKKKTYLQKIAKFYGEFSITKGDKISDLHVVSKKRAVVKTTGSSHNRQVYLFEFADFLAKNGQASIYTTGSGQTSASLLQLVLSPNCVAAMGERVNGVPQITVVGTGAFGYTGNLKAPVGPSATDKELAAVKITGSGDSATVTWTEGGVPKSFVYAKPPISY